MNINLLNYTCPYPKKSSRGKGRNINCKCGNEPWSCKEFFYVKKQIKVKLKKEFDNTCAFCQRALAEDEDIIIDIEHVLAKHKYVNYSFDIRNLVISCRRCNTGAQKGTRTDFINYLIQNDQYNASIDFSLDNYKFIHPKYENTRDFYELECLQAGRAVFMRYTINKEHPKLEYTFDFFNLKKLERGSLEDCARIMKRLNSKFLKYLPEKI
ncbi:hypothetical protein ABTE25_09045 [Acinetobacter baumannii]|uniref:hypothetical protein n=1 Tax=Acinetobacter baumannii TaxID=470 RepID=UPI0032B45A1F